MPISLQARVVFPVDRPPIEHGVVTIEGERIVAIGQKAECADCIDLGNAALLPGLVNAHTHLEFSHLRRPLGEPGMRLADWIRLVIAERGQSVNTSAAAIEAGLAESLRYGVTTIGDIASGTPVATAGGSPDRVSFLEVIGFSLARAESACAAVVNRLDAFDCVPNVRIGLSPHAPYTVSRELFGKLINLAHDRNLPVAMHLAESFDEMEFLESGTGPFRELLEERSMWDPEAVPRGGRPLDYLRGLAFAPKSLVIHGNYLGEELEFLAANADRISLIFCPRTHKYFGHIGYGLLRAVSAGVRVALGTDSRASNPDLDLLAEMRYVAGAYPGVNTQTILRMGTLSGAEALGRDAEVGSISPGKLANLVAIPLPSDARGSAYELMSSVLSNGETPSGVWLRGKSLDTLG